MTANQEDEAREDLVAVVSPLEAQHWLGVSGPTYKALVRSGLLGRVTEANHVFWEDLWHYERFGTQWSVEGRPELPKRVVPAELIQNMPPPPGIGVEEKYPGVQTYFYIAPGEDEPDFEELRESDTGWLAHFYLTPNTYMWPAPTSMGMVGATFLKLRRRRTALGAKLRTELYPDPWGSLALVTVFGPNRPIKDAFEVAYDAAAPVLDQLSIEYDVPLPISHALVVGIPSGMVTTIFPWIPEVRTLESSDLLLPRCPHPELRDAVALYREGVSSNNPFHQFLALWKAFESACGVRGAWRKRHKQPAVKVQEEVFSKAFAFRGYEGLTFDQVKQKLERPYRVALAHGGRIRDGNPKTAATADDFMSVSFSVPLVRHMAQVTLKNVRATLASSKHPAA